MDKESAQFFLLFRGRGFEDLRLTRFNKTMTFVDCESRSLLNYEHG